MTEELILVLSVDASCRPNPGYSGFGLFGYTLKTSKRPNKIKHPATTKYNFTSKGVHVGKDELPYETMDIYEQIWCIEGKAVTNNLAEAIAFKQALETATRVDGLTRVNINTDSKYTVTGFNEHLAGWEAGGWKLKSGHEVSHITVWKRISELKAILTTRGVTIDLSWVKGHDVDFGNNLVDLYSVIGSNWSKIQTEENLPFNPCVIDLVIPYKDYKDSFQSRDIVYYYRDLYFSSDQVNDRTFCFLSSSEDETQTGRRDTSSIFTVNHGYIPELVNRTKEIFRNTPRDYVITSCIKLNRLNDNKLLLRIATMVGIEKVLVKVRYRETVAYTLVMETTPFVHEMNREYPYIMETSNTFDNINYVLAEDYASVLDMWHCDLTDVVVENKKLKLTTKDGFLDLTDKFNTPFKFVSKLLMTVGKDIPPYLALKRLEEDIVRVSAIVKTRPDSNYCTLYTLIETHERQLCSVNLVNKFLILK